MCYLGLTQNMSAQPRGKVEDADPFKQISNSKNSSSTARIS